MNFTFPFSWECHHPSWRTHIFQRGRYTTNQKTCWKNMGTFRSCDCQDELTFFQTSFPMMIDDADGGGDENWWLMIDDDVDAWREPTSSHEHTIRIPNEGPLWKSPHFIKRYYADSSIVKDDTSSSVKNSRWCCKPWDIKQFFQDDWGTTFQYWYYWWCNG